jgi:hypothetical protein
MATCPGSGDYLPRPEDSEVATCDVCGAAFLLRPGDPIPEHESEGYPADA